MPIQTISVSTAGRETSSNSKSAPRSKLDKNEGGKATGKSGSRSSNVSKDANSKVQSAPAEKDTSVKVQAKVKVDPQKRQEATSVKVGPSAPQTTPQKKQEAPSVKVGPSTPQTPQKKQVKRRHHRKTSSSASSNVDSAAAAPAKQSPPLPAPGDHHQGSGDRSPEIKTVEKKKRVVRTPGGKRRERPLPQRARDWEDSSTSSSEDDDGGEAWTEARSWSKEKARRGGGGRHRSEGSRGDERAAADQVKDEVMDDEVKDEAMDEVVMDEVMELQSVCSQEGNEEDEEEKENRAPPPQENGQQEEEEEEGGPKQRGSASSSGGSSSASRKRGGGGGAQTRAAAEERKSSRGVDGDREQRAEGSSSSASSPSPPPAEEGEEHITKRYQETGAGGGDMSEPPAPQNNDRVHFGENGGGTAFPCSDDSEVEVCKICHCEGEEGYPLITPCHCTGSLRFVHQDCLNQWIKSSDTRCCELCKYDFIMETQLKPLRKWEKLQMSTSERRKIYCSVLFHLIAIGCVLWSIYVLVKRTADEIRVGRNEDLMRISLANYKYEERGVLDWPFWTKLIVVAIGFTSGLIFMYIQCKVYLQLWRRLKAFNRIITVQNCPPRVLLSSSALQSNGTKQHQATVEVPLTPVVAPVVPDTVHNTTDSECSVEAALAPLAQTPV